MKQVNFSLYGLSTTLASIAPHSARGVDYIVTFYTYFFYDRCTQLIISNTF